MKKSFTQQLKDLYGSHKVVDFYDKILNNIEQEDKNKLYWLDSCSIGHYLDIVFEISTVSLSGSEEEGGWMNTGLKFKDKDKDICFKIKVTVDENEDQIINDFYFDLNYDFDLNSNSNVINNTSPTNIINPDDTILPNCTNIDITKSEKLKNWDEEAMKEAIEKRRKFLRANKINFSNLAVIDIKPNDIKTDNPIYTMFHILIDGCDNLPLPLLQGLVGEPIYFKNESKLHRQYALLERNVSDKKAGPYNRVHSLKNIIFRQIKHSEQLLKEEKIDLLPFFYVKGGKIQYMLPLYLLHRPKPDAVLVIDSNFNPYTLFNMNEARMDYGFFRYLYRDKEGKIPEYKGDGWIYPDNCEK